MSSPGRQKILVTIRQMSPQEDKAHGYTSDGVPRKRKQTTVKGDHLSIRERHKHRILRNSIIVSQNRHKHRILRNATICQPKKTQTQDTAEFNHLSAKTDTNTGYSERR